MIGLGKRICVCLFADIFVFVYICMYYIPEPKLTLVISLLECKNNVRIYLSRFFFFFSSQVMDAEKQKSDSERCHRALAEQFYAAEKKVYELRKLLERRSEEHTSELQSRPHLVCRLLLEKKKKDRQSSN